MIEGACKSEIIKHNNRLVIESVSFLVGRFFTLTGRPSRNTCNVDVARQLVAKISKSNKDNSISQNIHISHFLSQTSIFYFWLITSAFESYCIIIVFHNQRRRHAVCIGLFQSEWLIVMNSDAPSSSSGTAGSADPATPRRNSKRPKCIYFSLCFLLI